MVDAPKEPALAVGRALVVSNLDSLTQRAGFQALLPQSAAPTKGYSRANLRACKVPTRSMPAASEHVLDSTVLVQTSSGFGSGFLLSSDGFVATAAHVVTESTASVKLRDGRQYPAAVIRVDRRLDVALLRLTAAEGTNFPCLPLRLQPVTVGSDVYAIGSPASRELSFSLARGIVSGVRLIEGLAYLQTDAAVNRGNSGGPLVTASGEAAAIISFKLSGAAVEGIAFGVPLAPALNAVGVTVGQGFTSPELVSAGPVPPSATKTLLQDRDDQAPQVATTAEGPKDTSVKGVGRRRTSPAIKHGIYAWGGAALVTGVSVLLVGVLLDDEPRADNASSKLRTVGWTTTALGGVLLGVGFALP